MKLYFRMTAKHLFQVAGNLIVIYGILRLELKRGQLFISFIPF